MRNVLQLDLESQESEAELENVISRYKSAIRKYHASTNPLDRELYVAEMTTFRNVLFMRYDFSLEQVAALADEAR